MEDGDSKNDSKQPIDRSITWEKDNERLIDNMTLSSQQILEGFNVLKSVKADNGPKERLQATQEMTQAAQLSERLQQILSQIYAIDHTIYVMFKMIKIINATLNLVNKPLGEKQFKEAQKIAEAAILYFTSAISFMQCLFGSDI